MKPTIPVVAAILGDAEGRVLIAQRPAGKSLAGWWEFPGGKLEAGESPEAALRRELAEELGVAVTGCEPYMELEHDYPERRVRLLVRQVRAWHGQPEGREGQALRWVARAELADAATRLLPADLPVAARLAAAAR